MKRFKFISLTINISGWFSGIFPAFKVKAGNGRPDNLINRLQVPVHEWSGQRVPKRLFFLKILFHLFIFPEKFFVIKDQRDVLQGKNSFGIIRF